MVLPAAIKRVLSLCTPVPTAALHGPRTAAAREAVPVCDGCKRPSANLMVNEFGVTCAACCMHALLGGDDAPCVRCGGPCVEGQMNAQHVCFACLCVEACGGERESKKGNGHGHSSSSSDTHNAWRGERMQHNCNIVF